MDYFPEVRFARNPWPKLWSRSTDKPIFGQVGEAGFPPDRREVTREVLQQKPGTTRLPGLLQCAVPATLFTIALACQRGLHTLFLAWFQIKSVPLDFLNDVLL
jgi:hypothetical protein